MARLIGFGTPETEFSVNHLATGAYHGLDGQGNPLSDLDVPNVSDLLAFRTETGDSGVHG